MTLPTNMMVSLGIFMKCLTGFVAITRTSSTATTTASNATTSTSKTTGCPDGWSFFKYDNTCLKAFGGDVEKNWLTWSDAREVCASFGGDLVEIRDVQKNNFVKNLMKGPSPYPWIGIRNYDISGFHFKYVDGSDLGKYHPWGPGEPEDDDGNCVSMSLHPSYLGMWLNYYCVMTLPYVCSKSSINVL